MIAEAAGPLDGSHEQARIAISNGNQIHVVFEISSEKIGYVRGTSTSPEVVAVPVVNTPATVASGAPDISLDTDETLANGESTPTAPGFSSEAPAVASDTRGRLVLSIIPVLAVVSIVLIVQLNRRRIR